MKKVKPWHIVLIVIGVIVLGVLAYGISTYNSLNKMQENISHSEGNIQTQLQYRADLVPNLVNTVKGYASHEEEIMTAVTDARAKMMGASTVEDKLAANDQLNSALSRLMMVVENYPDLKASQNFLTLQDQLESTENQVKQARRSYNEAVQSYNKKCRTFPSSIIAGMFGFEKVDYFQASEGAQSAPQVDFTE